MVQTLLKDRLKESIRRKGMNTATLAKNSRVRASFIYDILNGKSTNPNTAKMARISSALGVSLSALLGLDSEMTQKSDKSEYVMVTRMLTTSTDKGGAMIIEEKEGEPYYFRKSWVQERLNAQPENLRMIFVEGDSMEPSLCNGDMILIDITKKNPSPSGIFVLFDGMGLIAKRLEFLPHSTPPSIRILSDNSQYHPYERSLEETDIIGRVVWFAREI
ncbi:MAG: S24 family peptidase [Rickettsiales bacterium]|nr:S24 family peptidase [Rickettsiales bacterium]